MLPFLGNETEISLVDDTSSAADTALGQVGPRLKRIRLQRKLTLTGLANTTGISKSTLSSLETGQRRPTLELMLALSEAYRVPLDDLVGAPDVGDPRIRLKPGRVKGRTVIPLTRQPDGMQAWKIVIPTTKVKPEPRAHDGHEWIYVLSARCGSSSATRTGCSGRARSPSSTPRYRTGSAAMGSNPLRS
jgi:transcriptional regulator with XRE-family HTH domain